MNEGSAEVLRAHRAQVSADKRRAVLFAIDVAADQPGEVTVSGIARDAGVSREFIHSHADLREQVRQLAVRKVEAQRRVENSQADIRDGRAADRSTLMNQVIRQREKIVKLNQRVDELEAARARHLGEQLVALDETPAIASTESLVTSERLEAENDRLQRALDDALRLVARLQNELGGARQALAEALADGASTKLGPRRLDQLRPAPEKPSKLD